MKKETNHPHQYKWLAVAGILVVICLIAAAILRGDTSGQLPREEETAPATEDPQPTASSSEDSQDTASQPETAEEVISDEEAGAPEAAEEITPIQVYGTVTEITDSQISLENENQSDPYSSIVLNTGADTLILASQDFEERSLDDISVGDTLYAYVSPYMTRSIPPISNAVLILCEIPQDTAVPAYARITAVSSDDQGNPMIETDQELILIPGEETIIQSLDGTQQLSVSDLKAGDTILVRYQFMTMSIPAQTNPDEIRVLSAAGGN